MNFNIYNGSSQQEIAFMKKAVKKTNTAVEDVTDAVEQLESEVVVKRGHWYKYGEHEFTAAGTKTFEFDGVVSGIVGIGLPSGNDAVSMEVTVGTNTYSFTLAPVTNYNIGFMVDGLSVSTGQFYSSPAAISNFVKAGGISKVKFTATGAQKVELYVID